MQHLHSSGIPARLVTPVMGKVTRSPIADIAARLDHIVDARMANLFSGDWDGYAGAIRVSGDEGEIPLPTISRLANLEYLSDGDVVLMLPNGRLNVLYRRASPHNTILTTERCNSLCLMCSQ